MIVLLLLVSLKTLICFNFFNLHFLLQFLILNIGTDIDISEIIEKMRSEGVSAETQEELWLKYLRLLFPMI